MERVLTDNGSCYRSRAFTTALGDVVHSRTRPIGRPPGFDVLLTISNEIPPVAGSHPTHVDKRKLRKVAIHHLSWTQVLTEAVMQKVHRGVGDPDQTWILGELVRYLEHPQSGAMEFEDMGASWVTVR